MGHHVTMNIEFLLEEGGGNFTVLNFNGEVHEVHSVCTLNKHPDHAMVRIRVLFEFFPFVVVVLFITNRDPNPYNVVDESFVADKLEILTDETVLVDSKNCFIYGGAGGVPIAVLDV